MRQERDRVVDAILTLAPHVSIAHQVAGRIRLKISPSGIAAARKIDVEGVADALPAVREAHVHPFSLSIVIAYDEARIPSDLWAGLAALGENPETKSALEKRLRDLWAKPRGREEAGG